MPEADQTEPKQFFADVPARNQAFFLKGSGAHDWGMQNRLARVFRPGSGRTVMLAIDHGYFQGPTTGLERVDLSIVPLLDQVDALFCTRGILRSSIPAAADVPVFLRASGGPSILKDLSDEELALDMEDALRLNACGVGVQVFIGGEQETRTVHNMTRLVDAGYRHGMPVMGVTAVGRELTRDSRYLGLATRILAELGAQVVKTYYCEPGFEEVTAGCPVPVVMAGGKKLPELDALRMARNAIDGGAAGVDMGRNIFQSDSPIGMLRAINAVVHEGQAPEAALDIYRATRADGAAGVAGERPGMSPVAMPIASTLERLLAGGPRPSVGMLTADLGHLAAELEVIQGVGIELVHIDVMDGRFCPMLTLGPPVVGAMRTPMLKDVHLMIEDPLASVEAYVAAGADLVTFQVEGAQQPHRVLAALRGATNVNDAARGVVRGIAVTPSTSMDSIEPLLDETDYVLVLAVDPGWGGQPFSPATARRVARARELIAASGRRIALGIDGGVTRKNISEVLALGADVVVTGSAVFDGRAPAENARQMLDAAVRSREEDHVGQG